jgi:WD40 repeat protein
LWFGLFLIVALAITLGTVNGQIVEPNITLYVSNDYLILLISGPEPVLLEGFQFSVYSEGEVQTFDLETRFGILPLIDYQGLPGMCFIMATDAAVYTLPEACKTEGNFIFTSRVIPGDDFWHDSLNHTKRDIVILRNNQSIQQFCPSSLDSCAIIFGESAGIIRDIPTTTPGPPPPTPAPRPMPNPFLEMGSNQGEIKQMAWNKDGVFLVSGHTNGAVCLWDREQFSRNTPLYCESAAHQGAVMAAAWMPGDNRDVFVTGGADGYVRIWRVSLGGDDITFSLLTEFVAHAGGVRDVQWHPVEPRLITTGGDDRLILWQVDVDAQRATQEKTILINDALSLAWNKDGQHVSTIDESGIIRVVDTTGQEAAIVIGTHLAAGVDVSWNQAGAELATLAADQTVRLYNYQLGTICPESTCPFTRLAQNLREPAQLQFSPNGTLLAISTLGRIQVMEAQEPFQLLDRYVIGDTSRRLTAIAWSPDSSTIAGADNEGHIYLWEIVPDVRQRITAASRWLQPIPNPSVVVNALTWDANGSLLAIVDENRNLSIWDVVTQEQIGSSQAHTKIPLSVDWNLRRGLIATGGCGPNAVLWDVATLPQILLRTPLDHIVCVTGLAFSPDGELLATGDQRGVLRIWDWQREEEILTEDSQRSPSSGFAIRDVEWNRAGDQLATVSDTGLLVVWQWDDQERRLNRVLVRQPEPNTAITSLSWSPDGRLIATGSDNEWIVVWRVASTTEAPGFTGGYRLDGQGSLVTSVHWSSTNNWLVSAGEDGKVIVWDALTGQRLAQAVLPNDASPIQVKWSPLAPTFAVVDSAGYISLWDFAE